MKKKIFLISLITLISLFRTNHASALTMENDNWTVEMGNQNNFSGSGESTNYQLKFNSGETAPGTSSSSSYNLHAGFQYIQNASPFLFTISNSTINFGTITSGEAFLRTSDLSVSKGSAAGYQVTAQENSPLTNSSTHQIIPDTTCDAGNCSEITADSWQSLLAYGFGYRCDNILGAGCSSVFSTSSYYKQFPSEDLAEDPVIVMGNLNPLSTEQSTITYKINISGSQPGGLYQNTIEYIAIPTY